jgi:glycosyltransferase involved in cell wall biosynthesis
MSLVIPVWNDRSGLRRLLDQVDELKIFSEVVIVDDASDEDVSPDGLGIDTGFFSASLRYIRLAEQGGAGHARNVGLDHVSGSHVIFFDSDDLFGEEIKKIVSSAEAFYGSEDEGFDFCIFRHDDSRVTSEGGRGALESDEKHWRTIGAHPSPRLLSQREIATLSRIAAYPWNKLYDINFLRAHKLRCTELSVHNDVELHWNSFIVAKRILCTSCIGAEHFVVENGGRLTNRKSADRLRVFEAFRNVLSCLRKSNNMPFMLEPFTDFCSKLVLWIDGNLLGDFRVELEKRASRFFLEEYSREQMVLLAYKNPELARRINAIIVEGAK